MWGKKVSTNNVSNLLNSKIIYNITNFTTIDYPNHLACVVWFCKCNMRCLYCYNEPIVFSKEGKYSINELLSFLQTRKGLLDSVVLSGGEATKHQLTPICQAIKEMGFKIKLDSNGSNPKLIEELLTNKLIDYVALDFKAPEYKFVQVTQTDLYSDFEASLKLLINNKFDFEIRTTIHGDLLNAYDVNQMIDTLHELGYTKTYYLQNFLETPTNIGGVKEAKSVFNPSKINHQKLKVVYRN